MNNNFNNQQQMGVDFIKIQLASNANKLAKMIQITAILIIVTQLVSIVINIINAPLANEIVEFANKKTLTRAEFNSLITKTFSLLPYALIMLVLSITELVFVIITCVKQSKLNKELVLAGLNKYKVYPVGLMSVFVIGFFINIFAAKLISLAMIISIALTVIYIVIAVLMLKQSQQMKKDFNQNA